MKNISKKIKNVFTFILMTIIVFTSYGLYTLKDFTNGYKYFEIKDVETILLGTSTQNDLISKTLKQHIENLENEGYTIALSELNAKINNQPSLIRKSKTNDKEIKQEIIDNLDISVFAYKLKIDNDIEYFFKTNTECEDFINELEKITKQKYTIENIIIDYKMISSKEVLEQKINDTKAKAENQKRIIRTKTTTSRGGNVRQQSSYSGGAPMASYTYISSNYGMRHGKMHTGIDFAAPAGTHIYAWKDGKVIKASWGGSYGNFIIIQHNDGTVSRYAHCSGYNCSVDQQVSKGQIIGYVGTTGNSTGNHLHFEIQINGSFVNPLNYL